MNRYMAILVVFTAMFFSFEKEAQSSKLHPLIPLLDKNGINVRSSNGQISTDQTCSKCHDTEYISKNSHHVNKTIQVDCIQCHFENGKIDWKPSQINSSGELMREYLTIRSPENENCNSCHGLIHQGDKPIVFPSDFFTPGKYEQTKRTGEIISHQKIQSSFLNLEDKDTTDYAWDIHADRRVHCVDCHFASNNPKKMMPKKDNELKHLIQDPRTTSLASFLTRPDHNLTTSECSNCHNPLLIHEMIPYKKKHMERVACQSCHVPLIKGPALLEIDNTVLTELASPIYKFRNIDGYPQKSINVEYIKGYSPFLLPQNEKLKPYNFVTEWNWVSKKSNQKISIDSLKTILNSKNQTENTKLKDLFDQNKNGNIEGVEWVLDKQEKYEYIKNQLQSLLNDELEIRGEIGVFPVVHGILRGDSVTKDCSSCHSSESKLSTDIFIGEHLPGRNFPKIAEDSKLAENILFIKQDKDRFFAEAKIENAGFYVFGYVKQKWIDYLGLFLFGLTVLGIGLHSGYRILKAREIVSTHEEMKQVYMYSFYERLWHWTSALGIIFLLITGIEIHFPDSIPFLSLTVAVYAHNILAFILIVNAFLSFFYHVASSEIKQYFPPYKSFWNDSIAQIRYYTHGIFNGASHPLEKTKERKLNPLQQITYLAILNLLLPIQVITGLLIWGEERLHGILNFLGGLSILAPIHTLGSWMFLSFLCIHVYLTTTGHTWTSNIKAMVIGFEDVKKIDSNRS